MAYLFFPLLFLFACSSQERPLILTGTVEIRTLDLSFEVGGMILEIREEGEEVQAHEIVATLDPSRYRLLLEEAEHRLESITASYQALITQKDQLLRDLNRLQVLEQKGAVEPSEVEKIRIKLETLLHRIRGTMAEKNALSTLIQQRRMDLSATTLTTPITGVVLHRLKEPGERIAPGIPVITLGDPAHPWVRTFLPETFLGKIKVGDRAVIVSDTYPDTPIPAVISHIAPNAEFTPKTLLTQEERAKLVYRMKLLPTTPSPPLHAGQYVEIRISPR